MLIPLLLAAGCLKEIPKPDPGACAAVGSERDTYGEIGIGTCLSGPVDLRFFEDGGETWLAVANANPFLNFSSGSLLLIRWDSLDLGARLNPMDTLDAYALPMDDYVGGVGVVEERQLALVTSRFTPDSADMTGADPLYVVDLASPRAPQLWDQGAELELEEDPQPVVIDRDAHLAFVGNLTDHSISVIDTRPTPLVEVDVAADGSAVATGLIDADASGSQAVVFGLTVDEAEALPTDQWTLSWVEGTWRFWVPTDGGVERWSTGGDALIAAGTGLELESSDYFAEVRDPFYGTLAGLPVLYFADGDAIRVVAASGETIGDWDETYAETPLLQGSGWDARVGSPSVIQIADKAVLFYDGRAGDGADAAIGVATSDDGWTFRRQEAPFLTAPEGFISVEHPSVRQDPFTGRWQLWVSLFDGAQWSIGRSESEDGATWTPIEEVLRIEGEDLAAPWLSWSNSRHILYAAHRAGGDWSLSRSWSWGGEDWAAPEDLLATDGEGIPRVAVQERLEGSWSLEGRDSGPQSALITSGSTWTSSAHGFSLQLASGFLIDTPEGDERVVPGSYQRVGDLPTLYGTAQTTGGGTRLAAWQGDDLRLVAADLLPGVLNPSAPVVVGEDGDWTLYYSAPDASGATRVFRATSADGLTWAASGGEVLDLGTDWDALGQEVHSAQRLADGTLRLWYSGWDGARWRIGAADAGDGVSFTPVAGETRAWILGAGLPGELDDSGVRDPLVRTVEGVTHLWFAGTPDGTSWSLLHATLSDDGRWVRDRDQVTGEVRAALSGLAGTYSTDGVRALVEGEDGAFFLAGSDGWRTRIGQAVGGPNGLYPAQRFPTAGDTLSFSTRAGTEGVSVIPLDQVVEGHTVSGVGLSVLSLDGERGFLYAASKLSNLIYVIDVRDDSTDTWEDTNYLDIEAILAVEYSSSYFGFRDLIRRPGTDLLYATTRFPDTVQVIDLSAVVDDDARQYLKGGAIGDLPLTSITNAANYSVDDEGADSQARIAGAGMALDDDGRTLLVSHFRGNGLTVFDLDLGHLGEEIAWIPDLGENPHLVRVSPDGRYAVVANYLGQVRDDLVSSTLAVVDVDPDSDTYLEVVTWLVNREL
ncbi:MAG: hypothetical protein JXX28_06485 [Deltaproteobacteria bacterium]|nr:hypothetical protein [Deltaproteobacteria bacterium]